MVPTAGSSVFFPASSAQTNSLDDLGYAAGSVATDGNYNINDLTGGSLDVENGTLDLTGTAMVSSSITVAPARH